MNRAVYRSTPFDSVSGGDSGELTCLTGEVELRESDVQLSSHFASGSSEGSRRENCFAESLDRAPCQCVVDRRPQAEKSGKGLLVYNPDVLDYDRSQVITKDKFDGPGSGQSDAVVDRSRNVHAGGCLLGELDHSSATDWTSQDRSSAIASERSQRRSSYGRYDGESEDADQPSSQSNWSSGSAQARMRAWASVVVEMFVASRVAGR